MTNTKKTKEKGIGDDESQSEPKSTLVHTNGPSKQLANPSLATALQSPFLFTLCHPRAGSSPRRARLTLCPDTRVLLFVE